MCELLVDVQVESDSVTRSSDDPLPLYCADGRVIISVTAYAGNSSTAKPIPASLADGALSDTCTIYPTSNACSGLTPPIALNYSLTTAKVATL